MASSNSSEPELSRQEAIKVLEMFLYKQCSLGRTEFAYDADTVWKAVKMAAESLKTDEAYNLLYEETTKKDLEVEAEDCISRADAIKLLENYGSVEITNKLKALPTVYPKSDIDEDIYKASLNLQATALNDLWNTNKQLKKELEMLKLDRECDKPSKDLIRQMKSELADSLEFWDYSPNNNPLARDMLETINTYCAKMIEPQESEGKE